MMVESVRAELLAASDATIEDAVAHGDPMVLRGLLYQLTGDPELAILAVKTVTLGLMDSVVPAGDPEIATVRRKAVDFLKAYRDSGAGVIDPGPSDRLRTAIDLVFGTEIPDASQSWVREELALDPWARELKWQQVPDPERLAGFSVIVVGTGMGGLNAAMMLRRAGIPFIVFEKNKGVGGTWHENRYPGARVDSPSRVYSHIFGVDFPCTYNYGPHAQNQAYFDWVADSFDLRRDIRFETEVTAMAWDEAAAMWEVNINGPDGARTVRSNAVMTAVGFLNRPNLPDIEGMDSFGGPSWHTVHWPDHADVTGKDVAVIGTGCTGYQLVPELARIAGHVTVFQRTPQWLMPLPNYLARVPDQLLWLDRNMPYHSNFMRLRFAYRTGEDLGKMFDIDPDYDDPHSCSATNKVLRDRSIEFLEKKLGDPKLVEMMTPGHPVWSARPVLVDQDYCILDALKLDNVTLVTSGAERIDATGIIAGDGSRHDVDIIAYATGFKANEYLYPMTITGRGGQTLDQLWAKDGARAYLGCMMPGFPNLWVIYGPNTNGGLQVAAYHELTTLYALQCIERMFRDGKTQVEVREEPYWRYNRLVDARNAMKVWSDPRSQSYYWTAQHGRTAGMNPFSGEENWNFMRHPDFADLELS
jgi:4-hydroxyacetophenone monooxygenase